MKLDTFLGGVLLVVSVGTELYDQNRSLDH